MSDLVSRKWLMECVDEGWIKFDTEKDKNIYVHLVRDIAPSAQPEIIRCKDCKWKNRHNCTRAVEVFIDDDKYCAWAERRTNG